MTFKYKDFTFGQIEAILNKLGGPDGARSFLRNELIVIEHPEHREDFETWLSVGVGVSGYGPDDIEAALFEAGFKMNALVERMLTQITYSDRPQKIDLVRVTAKKLGLGADASPRDIFEAAYRRGLRLPPNESAAAVYAQHPNWNASGILHFAMDRVDGFDQGEYVFALEKGMLVRQLLGVCAYMESPAGLHEEWVFMK